MTTTTPTLPKHISDELRVILQKVHDDAVSPTHDSRLGYSERALEELATTLETEVQKAVELRENEITNKVIELDKNIRRFKPASQVKNKNSWSTGRYAATNYLTNGVLGSIAHKENA